MVYLVKIYLGNNNAGIFHLNDGFVLGNFVEFPLFFEVGLLSKVSKGYLRHPILHLSHLISHPFASFFYHG
jgi:hypothetical protein